MQIRIYGSQVQRNAPASSAEMTDAAAGAGVGQAMHSFGKSLQNVIVTREKQQQALQAEKDISDLQNSYQEKLLKAQEKAADGAPDMTEQVMKAFEADRETLTKDKSPFYNQYASTRLESLKSNVYNKSLTYQVQAERNHKSKLTAELIDNKAAYVRNNPAEFNSVLEDVYNSIEMSGLPQAERERQKDNARVNLSLSHIERRLEDNPATLAKDLREGVYHDKLPVPVIERYINAADRAAEEGQNTDIYSLVYEEHRQENGELDFNAVMKDLYDPAYQQKIGIGSKQADSVADLIFAKFTREKAVKENELKENQLKELNQAVELSINGDPITAISMIKKSENIDGEKKMQMIKTLKEDGVSKTTDPAVFNAFATRIASGQNIHEVEFAQAVAAGQLTFADKNNFINMQKQINEPKKDVFDLAIKQVDKAMSKGLLSSYTPIEAEAIARAKRRIMNVYNEAVEQGKSLSEVQALLSPDNITKIITDNKASLKEVSDSMLAGITKAKTENLTQRRPGETVADYLTRIKGQK